MCAYVSCSCLAVFRLRLHPTLAASTRSLRVYFESFKVPNINTRELNCKFVTTSRLLSEKTKKLECKERKNNFQEIKTSRDDERNQFLISFPDPCFEWLLLVLSVHYNQISSWESISISGNKNPIITFQFTQCAQAIWIFPSWNHRAHCIIGIRSRVCLYRWVLPIGSAYDWLCLKKEHIQAALISSDKKLLCSNFQPKLVPVWMKTEFNCEAIASASSLNQLIITYANG